MALLPKNERTLQESSKDLHDLAAALREQADSLIEMADSIERGIFFKDTEANRDDLGSYLKTTEKFEPHVGDVASSIYQGRRARDELFAPLDIFGEPAWDILLDLTAAKLARKRVSISSACIAACVPPTTALRWIKVLEKSGLVERQDDELDARRAFIQVSEDGFRKMRAYSKRIARYSQ